MLQRDRWRVVQRSVAHHERIDFGMETFCKRLARNTRRNTGNYEAVSGRAPVNEQG